HETPSDISDTSTVKEYPESVLKRCYRIYHPIKMHAFANHLSGRLLPVVFVDNDVVNNAPTTVLSHLWTILFSAKFYTSRNSEEY
ncbi:hypothetical protein NPIL_300351, partial [Nephila pilipes]